MHYIYDIVLCALAFFSGFTIHSLLPSLFSKKGANLANKKINEAIAKKTRSLENTFKNQYHLSKTKKALYQKMINNICNFLSKIKKFELEKNRSLAKGGTCFKIDLSKSSACLLQILAIKKFKI